MDELGHGIYKPMDIDLLPPLYLIYAENPSDSGKVPIAPILSFLFMPVSHFVDSRYYLCLGKLSVICGVPFSEST